ncbi:MAG: CCA tRNA nucleotidyltransferase [Planctomycetota bacterium]|nr:CCA tRNA nucleotidyltransferase [Planctomycetota bacterium]
MGFESARGRGSAEQAAQEVAAALQDNGHQAVFAGGCVRDRMLGLDAEDFDIATSATPEEVQAIFPKARGVGEFFGVMLIYNRGWPIQVATFRTEGPYSDHRRPDHVSAATIEEDAARRDFTMNGMYWDPVAEQLLDFHGGEGDLAEGVIRAIGDPAARLEEDHLRMLRCVRFAARFSFRIADETERAITAHRSGLEGISRERIGEEIRRMLLHDNRATAAKLLEQLGLAEAVLGKSVTGWAGTPHLEVLTGAMTRAHYATVLSAWAMDRGEEESPSELAMAWRERLMLSNDDRDGLVEVLEIAVQLQSDWADLGMAGQKRLASQEWFEASVLLLGVDQPELAQQVDQRVESLRPSGLAPPRLLGGMDLMEAGFPPGPSFSEILEAVYDAQLEGRIHSEAEALDLAKEIWQKTGSGN